MNAGGSGTIAMRRGMEKRKERRRKGREMEKKMKRGSKESKGVKYVVFDIDEISFSVILPC